MKTGFVVSVESIVSGWPHNFYLIDCETLSVIKIFDSMEELNIFADLNDYVVKDVSEAFPFKRRR